MNTREKLRFDVRAVFGSIPFPKHCSLRAACRLDDGATDPAELASITSKQDIHGEWWEIPAHELYDCQHGLTYLDEYSLEFYLPAYLTLALDDESRSWLVLSMLDAHSECDEQEDVRDGEELIERGLTINQWNSIAKDRLVQKFSKVTGAKRDVCLRFLMYAKEHFDPNPQAFYGRDDAARILRQQFWKQATTDHQ